jgi:hypothetical protein
VVCETTGEVTGGGEYDRVGEKVGEDARYQENISSAFALNAF